MIIYGDDPESISKAIGEVKAKDPTANITLRALSRYNGEEGVIVAAEKMPEQDGLDFSKMSKAELQDVLRAHEVHFESDANKARLIELAEGL